jgi:hypothetical protein
MESDAHKAIKLVFNPPRNTIPRFSIQWWSRKQTSASVTQSSASGRPRRPV